MKKQSFLINHGTYPFDVLVAIGLTHAEVVKLLQKKLERSLSEDELTLIELRGKGRTVMFPGGQTLLRVNLSKHKAFFHAYLAHEIFHAVEMLFDRITLKHSYDASEAFAYQIQHLTEQIYMRL